MLLTSMAERILTGDNLETLQPGGLVGTLSENLRIVRSVL